MSRLRLMSTNQWACDKNNAAWEALGLDCSGAVREHGFVRYYAETRPDVLGLQEVTANMAEALMRYLAKAGTPYALLWGRDTPILYRQDLFELVDSEFLIYPEEFPGYEGSFNNGRTKSYNMGVFREKASGKLFILMSTHLWWKSSNPAATNYLAGSDEARAYQLGLAMDCLDRYTEKYQCPAVIMGDFNAVYDSLAVKAAFARGFVHAHDVAAEYASEDNGHHYCFGDGFKPYEPRPFAQGIDHILVRGADAGFVRRFERYTPEYYWPLSDHSPVWIDVEL